MRRDGRASTTMATLVIDDPPALPPADLPFLPDKPFLSVREVAVLLDVKPQTIHALLRSGELRGLRIGREWRIPRADFEAWVQRALDASPRRATAEGYPQKRAPDRKPRT